MKDAHKRSKEEAKQLLQESATYRRRAAGNPKPRKPCPIEGCITHVTHLGNHFRRVHKTTASAVRQQLHSQSLSRTGECSLSPAADENASSVVDDEDSDMEDIVPPSPKRATLDSV